MAEEEHRQPEPSSQFVDPAAISLALGAAANNERVAALPQPETDWGAALLARGKLDGAIAKFASANQKGPHFADPLEMWGEALMQKNRSDLTLAKFEEADKYAPNWGRLHLKWGEAWLWSGDKAGAHAQLDHALRLDLAPAEKAELRRCGFIHKRGRKSLYKLSAAKLRTSQGCPL